jgi:CheY-like chemotaxis protein
MSHEIRTPLTGIIGFTGLLDAIPTLPDAAKAHIRRIVASGEALLAVVNDILDFSKLEAGQVELDVQPFDVRVFFEDALSMWATQAAAKKLDLRLRIDERTPAVLCADSARLGQIVGNLLSNAIKFTDQGEIGVGVSFNEPRGLRVAVTDTGSGIAADKLDRLFQRFSQIDGSVSRRHGGTGLGLSICKSLVELMGGEIRVDSTAGQGSTFEFRVEAVPGRLRGRNLSEAQAVAASDARPAHVLVVDDLAVNRVLVRAILEASGHRVEEAGGGAEAVAAAIGSKFDLILMDLQMPGMDGYAAATAIRALDSANRLTPIIALSANVLDEHVAASGLAGMNGHLAKPIVPAALLGAVAEWAGLRLAEKDDEVAGVSA